MNVAGTPHSTASKRLETLSCITIAKQSLISPGLPSGNRADCNYSRKCGGVFETTVSRAFPFLANEFDAAEIH